MYVDAEKIILFGSLVATICSLLALLWKVFKGFNHEKEQDKEIKRLRKEQVGIQKEQALIVYGLLACLKGLREKGCNGPVTEAIGRFEKHLNQKAHCMEEQDDDNDD